MKVAFSYFLLKVPAIFTEGWTKKKKKKNRVVVKFFNVNRKSLVYSLRLHSRLPFYALGRQIILLGLKANFCCPALQFHRSY